MIAQPARHTIALFVPDTGTRQVLGEIEVRPRPPAATMEDGKPSTVFCEVDKWSVRNGKKGEMIVVETLCGRSLQPFTLVSWRYRLGSKHALLKQFWIALFCSRANIRYAW